MAPTLPVHDNRSSPPPTAALRVAVAGAIAEPLDLPGRLAAAERRIATAAEAGARLLVLPQRFLTEGDGDLEAAALLSDATPLRTLAAVARRHGVAVASGYLECCSGRIHDAALFIDRNGLALANYRRTHLDRELDPEDLSPGHWFNLVNQGDHRFGLLVGADINAPEPARALVLAGAAAILVPAGHGVAQVAIAEALLRTRAYENGCGILFANQPPAAGGPRSLIVGPDGTVLAATGDGVAVADLPVGRVPAVEERLRARRPPLYERLTVPHVSPDLPRT
jgi:predicted amidohydrolase